MDPDFPALGPDREFDELEALAHFHYPGWQAWRREHFVVRQRLIFHLREKRAWESYWAECERRRAKREDDAKKSGGGWQGPRSTAQHRLPEMPPGLVG